MNTQNSASLQHLYTAFADKKIVYSCVQNDYKYCDQFFLKNV